MGRLVRVAAVLGFAAAMGCGSDVDVVGDSAAVGAASGGTIASAGQGGAPSASASGPSGGFGPSVGGGPLCAGGPDEDIDLDGFTPNEGDCNDCDPLVGPGAVEVVGSRDGRIQDEDCDGFIDEFDPPCDGGLAIDDADPLDAARAIELCKLANGKLWGVVKADWVMPDGTPIALQPSMLAAYHLGHGLLAGLGPFVVPQAGDRMLALSSGTARAPTDPGYVDVGVDGLDKGYLSDAPAGFPVASPTCQMAMSGPGHDGVALAVTVRTPSNVQGISFDFQALSAEWPNGVCSPFDDAFLGLLSPVPSGQTNGNIVFDPQLNPVTVNNTYFDYCACANGPPCEAGGKIFDCPLGAAPLAGTGFEGHASTGWLKVYAPVDPSSEIELRFTVYDAGDGLLDQTAVVDGFRWLPISSPPDPGTAVGP